MSAAVSALQPLSTAIYGILNVPAITAPVALNGAGCIGGVTDNPSQGRPFPFLWYEVDETDLSGIGQGPDVKQASLRLHVFSQSATFAEAQRIQQAAGRLLRFVTPAVDGWAAVPIDRPHAIVNLPFETINAVKVLELVSTWTIFVCEVPA